MEDFMADHPGRCALPLKLRVPVDPCQGGGG